jgi:hypothetical protein
MQILGAKVDIDRKLLAKQLAKPLSQLMTEQGDAVSASELQKMILDPNTTVEFPDVLVTATVSRVRVRVRRVVRVRSLEAPEMETTILER